MNKPTFYRADDPAVLKAEKDGKWSFLEPPGDYWRLTTEYPDGSWSWCGQSVRGIDEANELCRADGWPELAVSS